MASICFATAGRAQPLGAGSILFVGWNTDSPRDIAFVAVNPVPASTVIHFRDDEYSGRWLDTQEGAFKWTAPADGVAAGTVVRIVNVNANTPTASVGACAKEDNSFQVSRTEEGVYAYLSTGGWNSGTYTFLTAFCNQTGFGSYLSGTGLTDGQDAWSWGSLDNWRYNGIRTGTVEQVTVALADVANWSGSDDPLPLSTTAFTFVTDDDIHGPELAACAFDGATYTAENIGLGVVISGLVRDAVSGLHGPDAADADLRPRLTVVRPDGSTAVDGSEFDVVPAGGASTAWQPFSRTLDNSLLSMPGEYTVRLRFSDRDDDEPGDSLSTTGTFHFVSAIEPHADDDGDGTVNWREFVAGTDIGSADSCLRIVSGEPAGARDLSMRLRVGRGAGRTYQILASDRADAPKTPVAGGRIAGGVDGVLAWTNLNALTGASCRYYAVAVTGPGGSYTNNEEWAAYVQPRVRGQRYLVSVPVDTGDNRLDGELGRQLGWGLAPAASPDAADRLFHLAGANQWRIYYYLDSGGGVWWDEGAGSGGGPADLAVTAGTGFWIERRAPGTARVPNAVFFGRSYTSAPALPISTNQAVSGWSWTVIGWPLAQPGRHRNLGRAATPADQLGFVAAGAYGGRTGDFSRPHAEQGDQIWVWENNTWKAWYWLMGGIGPQVDGRWWSSKDGGFADFALEPGKAYYYRHHVSQSGTATGVNFAWQPSP